jgi:hypothetical protein
MGVVSEDMLLGKDQILAYVQRADWRAVLKLVKEKGFPAKKFCGRWESSRSLVDAWHKGQLS